MVPGDLNSAQREAVGTVDGPLLVLAGAGSGKTRVITQRVAHLLDLGVPPEAILAVSFTNKAADEMRERVEALVGARAARRLTLSTFHSLGLLVLKREKAALGFTTGFTIYDGADQLGAIREILRDVKLDDRRFDAKAILHRISRWKNAFVLPDATATVEEPAAGRRRRGDDEDDDPYDRIARAVYPRYQSALRHFHAVDFDDLIVEPVRLFDSDEAVRARWAERYRYVMIDEYQDTNRAQLLFVSHLARAHGNLCVVGDDDQSIYGWRGAEAGNILEFDRHYPGARVVKLEENYRSTPAILEAANAVIAHNRKRHDKRLYTTRPPGDRLQLVVAPGPDEEARFVADEIEMLRARRGYHLRDCAVLYRSNVQARSFEEALRAQRLPYRMIGGQAFYERKEVKDAIAYLKAALHPRDEIALRRIVNYPARGIGEVTVERCAAFAALHNTTLWNALKRAPEVESLTTPARESIRRFVELLEGHREALEAARDVATVARGMVEAAGVPDDLRAGSATPLAAQRRLENLDGFLRALGAWEERTRAALDEERRAGLLTTPAEDDRLPLREYLQRLSLSAADDDADEAERADQVTLVTLHGAKGLEFPVVFLVGLEEELLPHHRTLYPHGPDVIDDSIDLSEERRLLYVGITRAREILYLTRCRTRASRASSKPRAPSRFLAEIPAGLCESRDLDLPAGSADPADEEAFARDCLARLRQLTQ